MLKTGTRAGTTQIKTKDGSLLPFTYRASEVRVAHLLYFLSIGFID